MEVSIERLDGAIDIAINGRIDSASVSEFQHAIESSVSETDKIILVDMSQVAYINSTGLRSVLVVAKNMWKVDAKLVLYALQETVLETFAIAGFDKIIEVADSRDGAIAQARK